MTCPGEGDFEYADVVVDAPGHVTTESAVDVPENAINGVVVGSESGRVGSVDVYSRGLSTDPANNYIVLRWSGRRVVDRPGADFVVFENAFEAGSGNFMDVAVVEASSDGESWVSWPHDYVTVDETRYDSTPAAWRGFAGVTAVRWRSASCTSPYDVVGAGGDHFDIADLPDVDSFSYLRLTAAPTVTNPDTGSLYPKDIVSDGFDIDGVFARHTEPE